MRESLLDDAYALSARTRAGPDAIEAAQLASYR